MPKSSVPKDIAFEESWHEMAADWAELNCAWSLKATLLR
jgi:hypothetical protein